MLLSKCFINGVLRKAEMGRRLLSVVINEAHVISHWGNSFRKMYARLGILRALLPKGTLFMAMSATLGAHVRNDVLTKLQYDEKDYININLGNNRANVSLVVRAIQHPMNTYRDLDFLVPKTAKVPNNVKKSFVYADSVVTGTEIEQRLYENAPKAFREQGIIRPYSAAFSSEHRAQLMSLFKSGVVRILICTDAAGMVRSYTKSITLSVNKLTFVLWSRAAIFRISTLLFSGNYRHQFLHLFREPAELHKDTEGLGLLFCLWKSLCTRLI